MKKGELNDRQLKFCDEYIKTGNATRSYQNAGYKVKEKTAETNSWKLLQKDEIIDYLKNAQEKLKSDRIADMKEVHKFWTAVLRGEYDKTQTKDLLGNKLKASEFIAKTNGAFVERVRVSEEKVPKILDDIEDDVDD